MSLDYEELAKRIADAGFFTSSVEMMGSWDRITPCSHRSNGRLTGNSFWITKLPKGWFVGAWGGHIYSIDEALVEEFSIEVLSLEAVQPLYDFPDPLKIKYALAEISDADFERFPEH